MKLTSRKLAQNRNSLLKKHNILRNTEALRAFLKKKSLFIKILQFDIRRRTPPQRPLKLRQMFTAFSISTEQEAKYQHEEKFKPKATQNCSLVCKNVVRMFETSTNQINLNILHVTRPSSVTQTRHCTRIFNHYRYQMQC